MKEIYSNRQLILSLCFLLLVQGTRPNFAQAQYDLLLKGGHVIDPQNGIDGKRDVAIFQGKIAAVSPDIETSQAQRVADVTGLYVVPGLVDIH
jgi:dihydroorotase